MALSLALILNLNLLLRAQERSRVQDLATAAPGISGGKDGDECDIRCSRPITGRQGTTMSKCRPLWTTCQNDAFATIEMRRDPVPGLWLEAPKEEVRVPCKDLYVPACSWFSRGNQ